jgi:hypothetical protein
MRSNLPLTFSTTLALLAACGSDPVSEAPPSASAAGPVWVTHRDAAGAFEARFPSPPTLQELRPPRKSPKEMVLAVTNAQVATETRLLVATKVLMTEVSNYDCEDGMTGMVQSSLTGMGCTASEEKPRELQGLVGREISFTCQRRPMRGIMLIGCDARKISDHTATAYSMIAAYQNELFDAEEASTFVNSFTLLSSPAQ